mgnify:CR=1 FL=1
MGMMRRLIAVGVGLAAGAVAATVLKKLNDPILDEDEVMIPPQQPEEADETVEAPAAAEEPAEEPAREPAAPAAEEGKAEEPAPAPATDAPNANPVQLGAAEAPVSEDGKLDPTRIASPEDFGNWDDLGLPYLDYECDIQQSRHLILYGHNMGVGDTVRFSSLQNYREPEYYQEHPVIELDSLNGGQYYKIVAVYAITTRESDGDVFHFNQYVNFADDAAEQEYLDEVAKRAFYTTGDYARADERLLTLCTCTYEMSDARLLIMARPLRDGETLTADEVTVNPDPLLPARWPAGA